MSITNAWWVFHRICPLPCFLYCLLLQRVPCFLTCLWPCLCLPLHLFFVLPRLSSVLLYSSFCHDFPLSLTLSFALFHSICLFLSLIWFFLCFPPCPLSCLLSRLFSSVLPHLCPYILLLSLTLPCHPRIPLLSFLPSPLLYLITCLCPCFSVIGSKASFDYSLCIYGKKLRSFELSYDHMLHLSLAQSAFCLN